MLPEYLLSTPRLIIVLLTLGLLVFSYLGIVEASVFKDVVLLVFWYFFGSRGKEEKKEATGEMESKVN